MLKNGKNYAKVREIRLELLGREWLLTGKFLELTRVVGMCYIFVGAVVTLVNTFAKNS